MVSMEPTVTEPTLAVPAAASDVRPRLTLALLSAQHALIHAQSALFPLVFVKAVSQFGVGVDAIAFLVAVGSFINGAVQLGFGPLARFVSRRTILGSAGLVFGAAMGALAATTTWATFAVASMIARVGGSPQHTVGHALLAEQFGRRRGSLAISTHIAVGNLGTVLVPLAGGWLIAHAGWPVAVLVVGLPAIVVAAAILALVREAGTDREAALAHGSTWAAMRSLRSERDLLWLFAASSVAAAGRGLGIVTTFVPLYLSLVLHLSDATVAFMYTLLLVGSVPGPILASWLAARAGHRPVLVGSYLLAAGAIGLFVVAGPNIPLVWLALGLMSAFVFEESSLLQALLADVARPAIRDIAFSSYFTLMFAVGAVWAAALGAIVGALGNASGFPAVFSVMAASYVVAAVAVLPIREAHRGGSVPEGRSDG